MIARLTFAAALALCPLAATAQDIDFGDNTSEYARDGECDDRRFRGQGTTLEMSWADTTHDAADCKALFDKQQVQIWVFEESIAATECSAINFGSNASEYSDDGACDDPRFEGFGAAETLLSDDLEADANDCRRLCEFGLIGLREY